MRRFVQFLALPVLAVAYALIVPGAKAQQAPKADHVSSASLVIAITGSGDARVNAVASDAAGYTYVTGDFSGEFDFDPGPGESNYTSNGGTDFFVIAYTPQGAYYWGYAFGTSFNEMGTGIAVADGRVYVGGNFYGSVNLGPAGTISSKGDADGFILAVNAQTAALLWASSFGGSSADGNPALSVGNGHVYACARFIGPADFDDGAGQNVLTGAGSYDAALAAFNASDGSLVWAREILAETGQQFEGGVAAADVVYASATSGTGGMVGAYAHADGAEVFAVPIAGASPYDVAGSANGPILAGATAPDGKIWVASYDDTGSERWAKTLDGGNGYAMDLDVLGGHAYVGGSFRQTVDFDPGTGTTARTSVAESNDGFVARYTLAEGAFVDVETIGGEGTDAVNAVEGGIATGLIGGSFAGTVDLIATPNETDTRTSDGASDGFISRYTPNANTATESFAEDEGIEIAVYPNPARNVATVSVVLDHPQEVTLEVWDALGRRVATLSEGMTPEGTRSVTMNSSELPSGLYFVRATTARATVSHALTIVR